MATTYKSEYLRLLTDLAKTTSRESIKLEAIRLAMILRSGKNAQLANKISPELSDLLGLSSPAEETK